MKKLFLKLLTFPTLTDLDSESTNEYFYNSCNYLEINIVPLHESFVLKQYSNFVNPVIASSPLSNTPRAFYKKWR